MSDISSINDPTLTSSEATFEAYTVQRELSRHAWGSSQLCQEAGGAKDEGARFVLRRVNPAKMVISPEALRLSWQRLAALWHPALLPMQDFLVEAGEAYLVRSYCSGTPLREALAGRPVSEILPAFAQLLEATEYLHAHNILLGWREAKDLATNLWWSPSDTSHASSLKISDFGWEMSLNWSRPGANEPPEEFAHFGEKLPGRLHPYWDLRAIGALLYEMITQKVWTATPSLAPVPELPEIARHSAPLEKWLRSALSLQAPQAFAHVSAAKQALAKLVPGQNKMATATKISPWDESQLFHGSFYPKTLKKVMLQGGYWAFEGPAGSSKTHWALWLQRYLRRNGHEAWRLSAKDFFQLPFSFWEQANEEAFWMIDGADEGPVAPYLEQSPKKHVVLLGRDLKALKDSLKLSVAKKTSLKITSMPPLAEAAWSVEQRFTTTVEKDAQAPLLFLMASKNLQNASNLAWAFEEEPDSEATLNLKQMLRRATAQGWLRRRLWQSGEYFEPSFAFAKGLNDFPLAKECAERWGEKLAHHLKAREDWTALENWLGWTGLALAKNETLKSCKDFLHLIIQEAGAKTYQEAGRRFQKIKDRQGQLHCLLALAHFAKVSPKASSKTNSKSSPKKYLEVALSLVEKLSDGPQKDLLSGRVHQAVADFYLSATDWERAKSYLEQSVSDFWQADFADGIALSYAKLAQVLLAQGQPESANAYLSEALQLMPWIGGAKDQQALLRLSARLSAWQQQDLAALQGFSQAAWLGEKDSKDPASLEDKLRVVYYLEEIRQFERAQTKLKALSPWQSDFKAHGLMGLVYLLQAKILRRDPKKTKAASQGFAKALSALEESPHDLLRLEFLWECALEQAEMEFTLEKFDKAREHWQMASEAMEKYRASLSPYLQQVLLASAKEERLQSVGKEVR